LQGEALSEGQSEYKITANTSGIVHMSADYKAGYEEINTFSDKGNFTVDVPGKYLLTTKKLSNVVVNRIMIQVNIIPQSEGIFCKIHHNPGFDPLFY
jgi:hypothetical protein